MSKKITLTLEELEKEIRQAFIHGQGNNEMMEAGLERDETEDYVNSRLRILLNQNKKPRKMMSKEQKILDSLGFSYIKTEFAYLELWGSGDDAREEVEYYVNTNNTHRIGFWKDRENFNENFSIKNLIDETTSMTMSFENIMLIYFRYLTT